MNNPTLSQAAEAIQANVYSCTTNPAYCSKLLQSDAPYIQGVIQRVKSKSDNDNQAAKDVVNQISKDLMDIFLPVYEASGGLTGFVTVQQDPRKEEDRACSLEATLESAAFGKNMMAKIPVTEDGLWLIEEMVKHNIPICATEIFAVDQAVAVMDCYEAASLRYGHKPPIYITHITGIMDDYFKDVVVKENINISDEALAVAGTSVAYEIYRKLTERGFEGRMLGGGARKLDHYDNFIGLPMDITMNWPMIEELNTRSADLSAPANWQQNKRLIGELTDKLPCFRRSYFENEIPVDAFADLGPVMLFRTQFLNGYIRLLDAIRDAR